jgi:xylulokinase
MSGTQLVGIHLGTSGVRVAVYSLDGTLVVSGEASIEQQTTAAWRQALREAAPQLPDRGICSVVSTSGTAVLVDEMGEPVFRPQMYYKAAPKQANRLREAVATERLSEDIALSPTSPLSKVLRLREEHPERFDDVAWILSPATWLLYELRYDSSTRWRTVETDWANALKFGADVTTPLPEWFEPLIEGIDLPMSLFPSIRPPGSFIGRAESELARRSGLSDLKLYQGMTDGSASALASGILEPGDFGVVWGAASLVKYVSESIEPHDALYYHRHPIEGYLPGAAFDSGNMFQWVCDRLLNRSVSRGLELAQETSPGEEYRVFLQGNRSPFFDPAVGSSVLGLRHDTELSASEVHGRLVRGVATGIALAEYTYISIIENHFDTAIDEVRLIHDDVSSPDDSSRWMSELRASVWQRSVVQMAPRTTAGLLIPPALITSQYEDIEEASDALLRQKGSFDPDADISEIYAGERDTYFQRWEELADIYPTT